MTTNTDDDIIQIDSASTFTSLYTGALIPTAVTINLGDGVSHTWTETAKGFVTSANLASEWQSAYQKMQAGDGAQLTAIQRLEGNAEAVLENTGLGKLSVSQQNAFRQDVQREYDAIAAAQEIAQKTLGINPNAPLTVQSYLDLGQIIKGNSLLEELSVQGHGLNKPKSAAYDGYTEDFQNNTDNTTKFVGGGLVNNNTDAVPDFFDDNGLSHLPFGFKTVNGVVYQLNQNGAIENTLIDAITALNDSMYLRTYTSADFSQTTSTATSDAATGALAYTAAEKAYEAALTAQQTNPSTAAADISEHVNADGSYSVATLGAGTDLGQTFASSLLSYDDKGSIVSVKLFDGSGHVLATVSSDSSYDIYTYAGGSVDGVAYASLERAYNTAKVLTQTTYYNASGTAIGTETPTANGGYSLTLNGALAQVKTVNADGSWDTHSYLNAAGTVDGAAYASIDRAYTAANVLCRTTYDNASGTAIGTETPTVNGGYSLTLSGVLAQVKTVNSDCSWDVLTYQTGGAAVENAYSAASALLLHAVDNADGSGALTLDAANETVHMGPGALSATASGDTFALRAHAAETISAAGLQGETFAFQPGSGSSHWAATLSGLTSSDQFQFAASAFGGSNAATAWTDLLASAHYAGGAVTIADLGGDMVTFKGVTTSALAAMSSQFHFA